MFPIPSTNGEQMDSMSSSNHRCEMLPIPFNENDPITLFNSQGHCSGGSCGPDAPPPSSCGTSSDHSGSACPSPGPMKRFRQIYGDVQSNPQNANKRTNWTENWMNNHHHFSKPSTSTPSVISNGSAVSQLSTISVDTQLSVALDFMNLERNNVQDSQLPISTGSSSIENVDPCYFQHMRQFLIQILMKLSSMDESKEYDAVYQLYKIGKEQQFIYCSEPAQMSQVLQRLIEIVLRPNTKQRTKTLTLNVLSKITMAGNVCLSAIRSLESADRGVFLNAVIICLRPGSEEDNARYATNILSHLFTNPIMGEFFRRQARTQTIVRELMLALQQESYGFRHKFLRHIYYLIKPSRELKRFFHQSNGMQICLELFSQFAEEPMLYECAQMILLLIDGLNQVAADHFIILKGIQILATRLDHGSPRLLQCIARCLASASDSDEIANQSIDDALLFSIQLLASTEGDMVKHIVGFIANIQTKNREAKKFLQQNKAIPNLMFLLSVWTDSMPYLPAGHKCEEGSAGGTCKHLIAQKTSIDDLIDTVLLALNNLSNGVNVDSSISCQAIMDFADAPLLFLQILASTNRPEIIHIRTLVLLSRILTHFHPAMLDRFMYACTKEEKKGYAHILIELFFDVIQRRCSHSAGQKNDKELKMVASRSISVLNEFIKYPQFLGPTASLIRASNWNPFGVLRSMHDEELECRYMEFLYLLSASEDLLAQWAFYGEILRFYANTPHLSSYAIKIFNRIQKVSVNCINCNIHNNTGS